MATGQSSFSTWDYGLVSTKDGLNGGYIPWQITAGRLNSFPVQNTVVHAISPPLQISVPGMSGLQNMNSIIEVLPGGLQNPKWTDKYMSPDTAATLAALRT